MLRHLKLLSGVVVCILSSFAASASAEVRYSVMDLGTLPDLNYIRPLGINESGKVVGYCASKTGPVPQVGSNRAFLYDDGHMFNLGLIPNGVDATAYAINSCDQVVGVSTYYIPVGASNTTAFLYSNETMTNISSLDGGCAFDINDSGYVVGEASNSDGYSCAFLYYDGLMTSLGTLGGMRSCAKAINAAGIVVGYSEIEANSTNRRAFLYDNDGMHDLGTLGGNSYATDINNAGTVIGYSALSESTGEHAFLFQEGNMHDLGTLGGIFSQAYAINNRAEVVGRAGTASGDSHACLWKNGQPTDLNTLIIPMEGIVLYEANDINNSGMIIAAGVDTHGMSHGFLLTPIPEPSTAALAISGLALLLLTVWRRKYT